MTMTEPVQQHVPLFRNAVFTKSFVSYALSSFGDWFDMIAMITLFTFVWQADPVVVALIPLMYAVPSIFLSQFAGLAVDRWKKVPLMYMTDFYRGILTVLLIFAPNPYWALAFIFLRSVGGVFHSPAQQTFVRFIVPEEQLMKANSYNEIVFQFAKIAGPLLGSALAAAMSVYACLTINAVSFFLSGALLLTIGRIQETVASGKQEEANKEGFATAMMAGWKILLQNRLLLVSTTFLVICLLALYMIDVQIGVLLREFAPEHSAWLGWCISFVGIGTMAVGILLSRKKTPIRAYGWWLGGGAALLGAAIWGVGMFSRVPTSFWLFGSSLCIGLGVGLIFLGYNYLRQMETPKEVLGRVIGIVNSMTSAVVIAGPMLGGVLTNWLGVDVAFQISGLAILCIGVIGLAFQRIIWGKPAVHEATQGAERC